MLLSNAMMNQDTCLDGFTTSDHDNNNDRTYELADNLKESMLNIFNNLGNSLDMFQKLMEKKHSPKAYDVDVEFPSWISKNDKRLIHGLVLGTNFNLTVAKDGT
ncbi:unnamed protein product [Arabis nemorensis]|uniref:Pectinesterase inhibitor domain-containing protein n=1 Tax=Arabis nemorensis TaxID=586526 RepID=A0A565AX86_9BRAS|nr:unnamed protein product [Arabis nemorensis]